MKICCYGLGLKSSKICLGESKELCLEKAYGHRASLPVSVEAKFCFEKKKTPAILLAEKVTFSNDIQKRN